MAMFRLDDHVNDQRAAQSAVTGALATWTTGETTVPVLAAITALEDSGAPGGERLGRLARDWARTPAPRESSRCAPPTPGSRTASCAPSAAPPDAYS